MRLNCDDVDNPCDWTVFDFDSCESVHNLIWADDVTHEYGLGPDTWKVYYDDNGNIISTTYKANIYVIIHTNTRTILLNAKNLPGKFEQENKELEATWLEAA